MPKLITLIALLLISFRITAADSLSLPDDPRQSISYWKSHTLSAEQDARVGVAERVFSKLLRAWDGSRVEPGLYVVDTRNSAWAASLADGNILLSLEAIEISFTAGSDRGEHLLAFVLAHELAHQRSDDLWHQRFFRNLQQHDQRERLLDGLPADANLIRDIEQKEAQADHDGLVLMASVGFDPWQILEQQDFFTRWVESIWKLTCDEGQAKSFVDACRQAQTRALRARVQLNSVVGQAAIYDLGIQALVAGKYPQARQYFTLYGREYPGRAIMSAIGASYLAEAMETRQQISRLTTSDRLEFYYPLLLDAGLNIPELSDQIKRSAADVQILALQERLKDRVELAVRYLEKAIRLDPDYRPLYISVAIAHLIENNQYLVRGMLQGRYLPKFGNDSTVSMMLALSEALEGDYLTAAENLQQLLAAPADLSSQPALSADLYYYTVAFNLAEIYRLLQRQTDSAAVWQKLAKQAQSQGRAFLFRLALSKLNPGQLAETRGLAIAPTIKGVRLGDRKPRDDSPHQVNDLWIEGELFHVYAYQDGARYISAADGKIVSASQVGGENTLGELVSIGQSSDRPLKTLGIPDRRLQLTSGEYIAYDRFGLALKLDQNRVQGWFLYP